MMKPEAYLALEVLKSSFLQMWLTKLGGWLAHPTPIKYMTQALQINAAGAV